MEQGCVRSCRCVGMCIQMYVHVRTMYGVYVYVCRMNVCVCVCVYVE